MTKAAGGKFVGFLTNSVAAAAFSEGKAKFFKKVEINSGVITI